MQVTGALLEQRFSHLHSVTVSHGNCYFTLCGSGRDCGWRFSSSFAKKKSYPQALPLPRIRRKHLHFLDLCAVANGSFNFPPQLQAPIQHKTPLSNAIRLRRVAFLPSTFTRPRSLYIQHRICHLFALLLFISPSTTHSA